MKSDEDALTCDFAETYHIYDWRALDIDYAATLAAGLRQSSRSFMKLTNVKATLSDSLEARIVDELQAIRYSLPGKKRKRPEWISDKIIHGEKESEDQYESFASPDEFRARWKRLSEA